MQQLADHSQTTLADQKKEKQANNIVYLLFCSW